MTTTGIAIGEPRWQGSETDPTGFDWTAPNTYVPAGVAIYRNGPSSLEIIGVLTFHSSRGTVDATPPTIDITSPADGAVVTSGTFVDRVLHVHRQRRFRPRDV